MRILKLFITTITLVLAGCGGGSCGSEVIFGKVVSCTSEENAIEEYTAAASKGELVRYKIDKKAMTYNYTIISSAYGLKDISKSGSLSYNADDDTYTPVGLGSKIAFNSDGLFYGVIKEDFGSGTIQVPVFGVKNIEKEVSNISDYYNFISYQCIGSNPCSSQYGSMRIDLNGYWNYCQGGNLAGANSACTSSVNGFGFFDSTTNKIILIDQNANSVGSAVAYVKGQQKVFIIDLDGGSPTLGKGMVIASSQSDAPSTMDGIWRYIRTQESGRVVIAGTNITQYIDGVSLPSSTHFTANYPWQGFATTVNNTIALAAGSGLYAARTVLGDFSIGLRK